MKRRWATATNQRWQHPRENACFGWHELERMSYYLPNIVILARWEVGSLNAVSFLPSAHPPGGNHSAIPYPLMLPKLPMHHASHQLRDVCSDQDEALYGGITATIFAMRIVSTLHQFGELMTSMLKFGRELRPDLTYSSTACQKMKTPMVTNELRLAITSHTLRVKWIQIYNFHEI